MSSTVLFTTKKTNRPEENNEIANNSSNKRKKITEEENIKKLEANMEIENEKKDEMKIDEIKKDEMKIDEINQDKKENKDEKIIIEQPEKIEDDKISSFDENTDNSKNEEKKKTRKRNKEREKKEFDNYINSSKKNKKYEKSIRSGYEIFLDSKYEWDIYLINLLLKEESNLQNFKEFPEDYTYYIYNNLRGLRTSKEFINLKNLPVDTKLNEEIFKFCFERCEKFIKAADKYKIKKLDEYKKKLEIQNKEKNINNTNNNNTSNNNINNSNTNNSNTNDSTKSNNNSNIIKTSSSNTENSSTTNTTNNQNTPNIQNIIPDFKLEILTAALVYNSLIRNEKDQERFDKEYKKNNQIKIEVLNFNLNEESMMALLSGIKFNTNVTEINLSGNLLGPYSLFWLGGLFKTNPNIEILDLTRCGVDNDCLFMFIQGTKYSNENLNNEQLNLKRLNLKDNNQITDEINKNFEHPLSLILERFKLTWLNLTNAKIKNKGVSSFLNTFKKLMKEGKIYMENLIFIANDFFNESCLEDLGDIIVEKNCPLKNIILSKNLISTPIDKLSKKNYFEIFMKKVAISNIKELFLISCGIGKNENDIKILYDMLCENKSLISLRLFGNEIKNMEDFSKILGIFSEYKGGLKNTSLKSLDLSKNNCYIKIDNEFLDLIEKLKLEYLDINQNTMDPQEKETFRNRTNELNDIKIIY